MIRIAKSGVLILAALLVIEAHAQASTRLLFL